MNIFKAINAAVQTVAKFIAFIFAFVFTFVAWLIYKIDECIMLCLAAMVWSIALTARVLNYIAVNCLMVVPAKIAEYAFMFALDIDPAEREKHLAEALKKYAEKVTAERLPPVTDFQRGQEDMRERIVAAIGMWFERDRKLPANAATAQTIQELIRTIPAEAVEEAEKLKAEAKDFYTLQGKSDEEVKNDPS